MEGEDGGGVLLWQARRILRIGIGAVDFALRLMASDGEDGLIRIQGRCSGLAPR